MLAMPLYDDNPRRGRGVVTYGLIAACTAVFLWQASLPPRAANAVALGYGMVPALLFGHARLPPGLAAAPPWATVLTSMFLHGGWLHLGGNMLYLWLFGRGVESAIGGLRFLLLYGLCGIAAALAQAAADPAAEVPMIGASGAIAGVLGAYLLLYPRARVTVFVWVLFFVRLVALPSVLLLGLWFLLQLVSGLAASPGEPGVAVWAHVAGFLVGMALILPFRRRRALLVQAAPGAPFAMRQPGFGTAPGHGSVPRSGAPRRPPGPWD